MGGSIELSNPSQYRPTTTYTTTDPAPAGGTLLSVLVKQWRTAVIVAAVSAAVLLPAVWVSVRPQYQVSARVRVAPVIRPILFNDDETDISRQFNVHIATQAQSLVSPAVLEAAIELPELKTLPPIAAWTDPVAILQNKILVEQIRGTELLSISMTGENAQHMVAILNGVLKTYLSRREDDQKRWDDKVFVTLRKEETELQSKLTEKAEAVRKLMADLRPGVAAGVEGGVADTRYTELQRQLTQASTDIVVSKARIELLDRGGEADKTLEGEGFETYRNADPQWLAMVNQQRDLRTSAFNDVAAGRGPSHPEVATRPARLQSLKEEIAARENELRGEYKKVIRDRLENKLHDAEATAKALQVEIGNALRDRSDVAQQQIALKSLEDERQRLEQAHMQVKQKIWNVSVEQNRMSRVTIDSPPTMPLVPNLDRRPKYLLAAIFASLFFGASAALVRSRLDRSVHEPTEVSTRFGLPVLGSVQYLPNTNGQGFGRDERMLESMRFISTALAPPGRARQPRVRLITSPTRGAGKSTVATHLAKSLAASGRKVLLIDADNYGQGASRECGVVGTPGFREFLEGKAPLDKVIQKNHTENLSLISSGERSERFGELLSRQASHERIRAAFTGYEEVIVDSAPVLASSSSVVLAALVDEIVLVIRAGRSTNEEVQAARQHLTMVGGKIIGAVLNAVDGRGSSYFYSYAYDTEPPKPAHV